MLVILEQCQKDILTWPEGVRGELADAIARLERGHMLSMPLSRPMPSIGKGVHELRFRDRSGVYRTIYFLAGKGTVYLLHAFQKKSARTAKKDIQIARGRFKEVRK